MPAIRKTLSLAFDIGDQVFLIANPEKAPGYVTGICFGPGWVPSFVVSFAAGETDHFAFELSPEFVPDYAATEGEDG
jgi:hypothetical protein